MNFLIRTKENRISGPFPKDVILARMQSGELREMDEVCPASGYWIYLHERDESLRMLGVALARTEDFHEENTETDTETVTATQPMVAAYANTPQGMLREARDNVTAATAVPTVTSRNRPELIRILKFILAIVGVLVALILIRVYQVANHA